MLDGAWLGGVDLSGAHVQGASPSSSESRGASLDGAELQGATLKCAKLDGAWLTDAHLEGATSDHASLISAELIFARLEGASLRHTCLAESGAILKAADLSFSSLFGVYLEKTTLDLSLLENVSVWRTDPRRATTAGIVVVTRHWQ